MISPRATRAAARQPGHWSYSILSTLLHVLETGHAKWKRRLEFYRAEFDEVRRRTEALRRLVVGEAVP